MRVKYKNNRAFSFAALVLLMLPMLFFAVSSAFAACTSPSAPDGAKEWFSGDGTYKFCIGSSWVNANEVGTLTSCSTGGQWEWDSSEAAFKQCDGSDWQKVACGGGGGSGYAGGSSFTPNKGNCTVSEGGSLTQEASIPMGYSVIDFLIWGAGGYVFVHNHETLRAYAYTGAGFAVLDSIPTTLSLGGLWADGEYVYTLDIYDNELEAYSFDGESFSLVDTVSIPSEATISMWGDGTYIYLAMETSLRAYSFNGTTFASAGNVSVSAGRLWHDGTYLYATRGTTGLSAYSFNGSSFSLLATYNSPGTAVDVSGDQNYIYLADKGSGLRALTFNGSSFTSHGVTTAGGEHDFVWADGVRIYSVTDSDVRAFTFNGSSFSQVSSTSAIGRMWGDGTTFYTISVGSGNGLVAHSGSGCTTPAGPGNPLDGSGGGGACVSLGACATVGQMEYDSANAMVEYCDGSDWYALDANNAGGGGGGGGGGSESGAAPVWVTPTGQIGETWVTTFEDLYVHAEDESGTVTYSKVSGDSSLSVSSSGEITGLPSGTKSITVRATDGSAHTSDRTFQLEQTTKVLCTYYNGRGMVSDRLFEGDLVYAETVHPQIGRAYRAWANPLIGWLKENEGSWADQVVYYMVHGWAQEMAYRTGWADEGSLVGWLLSEIGEPLHYVAGYFIPETEVEKRIREKLERRHDARMEMAALPDKP